MEMDSGLSSLDRDLACEASLEPFFRNLLPNARRDGWSSDEIANALLSLTQNLVADSRADAFIELIPPAGTTRH